MYSACLCSYLSGKRGVIIQEVWVCNLTPSSLAYCIILIGYCIYVIIATSNKTLLLIQETSKGNKPKSKSFVSRGDIVPVLAPEKDEAKFWLFLCASKCKRDGRINGK